MLKKVFKYDFQAIKRYWWLMAILIPGVALVAALLMRHSISLISSSSASENPIVSMISTMEMLFSILALVLIFSSAIVTQILIFIRFYKHFYSDEGYLTFTLPVSRRTLFLSKTLNAMVWSIFHFLLIGAAALICFIIIPIPEEGIISWVVFEGMWNAFKALWELFGGWTLIYTLEIIVFMVLYIFFQNALIHLCITIGAVIAKRAKIIVAIAIWYGVSGGVSFVAEILVYFGLGFALPGFINVTEGMTTSTGCAIFALIGLLACLVIGALGFICYAITMDKIERKLNLA